MGGRASEALRRREVDQLRADWINREDVKLFWRGGERADAAAVTGVDGLADALTVTVIEGADEDAPSLSCVRLSELDSDVQGAYEAYLELISPFPHTDRPAGDQPIRDWAATMSQQGFTVLVVCDTAGGRTELVGCLTLQATMTDGAGRDGVHMSDFAIRRSRRRQGYGSNVIRAIQARAHTRQVWLGEPCMQGPDAGRSELEVEREVPRQRAARREQVDKGEPARGRQRLTLQDYSARL